MTRHSSSDCRQASHSRCTSTRSREGRPPATGGGGTLGLIKACRDLAGVREPMSASLCAAQTAEEGCVRNCFTNFLPKSVVVRQATRGDAGAARGRCRPRWRRGVGHRSRRWHAWCTDTQSWCISRRYSSRRSSRSALCVPRRFGNLSSCPPRPRTASPSLERIAPPDPFRFPVNASHRRRSTTCASTRGSCRSAPGTQPYAVTYDSVLASAAVVQGAHAAVERLAGAAGASERAPSVPDVERRQSHAAHWLNTVSRPGRREGTPEQARLDCVTRVENAVTSVPDENFCRRAPRGRHDADPRLFALGPPGAQETLARRRGAPRQFEPLSFEQFIREWFETLAARAAAAPNATGGASGGDARPRAALGFSDAQADQFAEALAAQPGVGLGVRGHAAGGPAEARAPGRAHQGRVPHRARAGLVLRPLLCDGRRRRGGGSPETGSASETGSETSETGSETSEPPSGSPPHAVAPAAGSSSRCRSPGTPPRATAPTSRTARTGAGRGSTRRCSNRGAIGTPRARASAFACSTREAA